VGPQEKADLARKKDPKTVIGSRSSALGKNIDSMAFADDQRPKTNDE
jgi:hypothetical protein